MPRYYSLEQIKSAIKVTHEKYGGMSEEFDLYKLMQMPTADVQPVKHGKWIAYPACLAYDGAYIETHIVCSECGHVWDIMDNDTETFNYCPNCGARMEERDDADT